MASITLTIRDGEHVAITPRGGVWDFDRFADAYPRKAALAAIRRERNEANFDKHHPILGWLMDTPELQLTPPCIPCDTSTCFPSLPVVVPPPANVIPEPSSGLIVAIGLAAILGRLAIRRLSR